MQDAVSAARQLIEQDPSMLHQDPRSKGSKGNLSLVPGPAKGRPRISPAVPPAQTARPPARLEQPPFRLSPQQQAQLAVATPQTLGQGLQLLASAVPKWAGQPQPGNVVRPQAKPPAPAGSMHDPINLAQVYPNPRSDPRVDRGWINNPSARINPYSGSAAARATEDFYLRTPGPPQPLAPPKGKGKGGGGKGKPGPFNPGKGRRPPPDQDDWGTDWSARY